MGSAIAVKRRYGCGEEIWVWRTGMLLVICCHTVHEDQGEGVSLLDEVSITRVSKGCGEMCTKPFFPFSTTFLCQWKVMEFWILTAIMTYFAYMLFTTPIINKMLERFSNLWVHHKIRTAENKSPLQLFIMGMQQVGREGGMVPTEYFEVLSEVRRAQTQLGGLLILIS